MERLEQIEAAGNLVPLLAPTAGIALLGTPSSDNRDTEFASLSLPDNTQERTEGDSCAVDGVFAEIAAIEEEASGRRQSADTYERMPGENGLVNTFDAAPWQHRVQAELPSDPMLTPPLAPRHGAYGSGMPANMGMPPNFAGAYSGGSLPVGSSTGGGIGGGGAGGNAGGGGGGTANQLNLLGVLGDFSPQTSSPPGNNGGPEIKPFDSPIMPHGDGSPSGSSPPPPGGTNPPINPDGGGQQKLNWNSQNFNWMQTATASPTITTPVNQTNTEGDNVSLQIQASDPNHYPLSYDAVNLPPGLSINNSTGIISGTVAYGDAAAFDDSYTPTIIVADNQGGSASTSFNWTINEAQIAPTLTNPGNQTNLRGDSVSLQITASEVDNNPLTYQASNLPPGLTIDPDSGLISGAVDPAATLNTPYAVTLTASDGATGLSTNQNFTWTINATNVAPVLTNPGNQTNAAGDGVALQLSATDADGDALTYTATGLPSGLTLDPIAGIISGTLPNSAASGTAYNVTVTASDGMASSSQSFTWTVNYVGLTNPGDQSNLDGDSVSLQLTGSDANNLSLTYSASNLPPGLSINSSTGLISGTISTSANNSTPYAVTVSATDGTHSANQSFNWSVARLALANPGDQENQEDTAISLQLSVTDVGGTPSFSATGLPVGLSINSTTGLISGTIGTAAHGSSPYQVTVAATDGSNNSTESFVWTVTPRVALVDPGEQSNAAGDSVSLQLSATSPGGTITYSATGLPGGLAINSSSGLIFGTIYSNAASSTPYTVTVTANDGTSSSSQIFLWNVSTIYVVPPSDQTNLDDDAVSLPLTTHYHGSGTLSYSATGLPTGLTISSTTGQISGTVANTADPNSPYTATVTATDGTNSNSQTFYWTINQRVSIAFVDDQNNTVGEAVSLTVSGSDAVSGQTLTYSATGLPSGLSINSSTGVISGTIATGADVSSPYSSTVTVSDGTASASQTFNWTVAHLSLTNPGPQWSVDGKAVSLQLQAHDADGDTLTYSATGLPSGLSLNSTSGLISGTLASNADASSPYIVTVTAGDGTHNISQTFVWTVSQVSLTAPANQTNTEGDNVSLQLQGVASTGTLSYSAIGLPDGLSLNTATGLVSGTIAPGAAADGPFTVNVAASNGTDSASQTFTWTVNPVVSLTAPTDQSNNEGNVVSLQVTATDSKNLTLTYSADNLPAGLSINSSTGLISGTVSTGDAANGPYAVTVTASDGTYSASQSFFWAITHSDTTALTMTNPGTQSNAAGESVNLAINASDPDGVDALSYSATGLPDGLDIDSFSGIISGTVAEGAINSTPYSVTVTADDGNGQTISQTFNWCINDPATAYQSAAAVNAVEGTDTGSITLATFTTPDLQRMAGDYTATINWGDGDSNDTGSIDGGNGSFTVSGDHTYAEKGSYPLSVTITDNTGISTTVSNTATVTDAALSLSAGFQAGAIHGQSSTFSLGSFTDGDPNAPSSDYTTTINWGDDSSTTQGVLSTSVDGEYTISGTHTYSTIGTFTVTVTLTDVDGASATASDTVVVGNLNAGLSTTLNGLSFTDTNTSQTASNYSVTIGWGDGTPNTVVGASGGNGSFTVNAAQHNYLQTSTNQTGGVYQVTVTVNDTDLEQLTTSSTVAVVRPSVSAWANNLVAQPGTQLNNAPMALLTDPDVNDGPSEFSATIDWGDGNSSNGTIVEVAAGLFEVQGTHEYISPLIAPTNVHIVPRWNFPEQFIILLGGGKVGNQGNLMPYELGFNGGGTVKLQSDDKFVLYSPQWLDKNLDGKIETNQGDVQWPFAHVSNMQLSVQVEFWGKKNFVIPPGNHNITFKMEVTISASFTFVTGSTRATLPARGTVYTVDLTTSKKLPNYTAIVPKLNIQFEYRIDNGGWLPAGQTENLMYLTYKQNSRAGLMFLSGNGKAPRFLQTVFALGSPMSGYFDNSRNPLQLVQLIWGNFSSLNVKRALDGQLLSYYKDWNTGNTWYDLLVSNKDGQCNAWATLMEATLLAEGLDNNTGLTLVHDEIRVDKLVAPPKMTGFLVKNWDFNYPIDNVNDWNSPFIKNNKYVWGAVQEATYPSKKWVLFGQGKTIPIANFIVHQTVEVDVKGNPAAATLYDPSYGKMYQGTSALEKFQDQAIAGFYYEEKAMNPPNKILNIFASRTGLQLMLTMKRSNL